MAESLLSRVGLGGGGGWMVITRFKAKTQFKLYLAGTGTGTELGKNISDVYRINEKLGNKEIKEYRENGEI